MLQLGGRREEDIWLFFKILFVSFTLLEFSFVYLGKVDFGDEWEIKNVCVFIVRFFIIHIFIHFILHWVFFIYALFVRQRRFANFCHLFDFLFT